MRKINIVFVFCVSLLTFAVSASAQLIQAGAEIETVKADSHFGPQWSNDFSDEDRKGHAVGFNFLLTPPIRFYGEARVEVLSTMTDYEYNDRGDRKGRKDKFFTGGDISDFWATANYKVMPHLSVGAGFTRYGYIKESEVKFTQAGLPGSTKSVVSVRYQGLLLVTNLSRPVRRMTFSGGAGFMPHMPRRDHLVRVTTVNDLVIESEKKTVHTGASAMDIHGRVQVRIRKDVNITVFADRRHTFTDSSDELYNSSELYTSPREIPEKEKRGRVGIGIVYSIK